MNSSVLATQHHAKPRRAIGIVRVSQVSGRSGERFVSPDEQRERIEAACAREGMILTAVHEELDVSGGKALDQRPGLKAAVTAIETGQADVIAAAYFDRLFRSLSTQRETIDRVEHAGGEVLAVDIGQVTNGSAGQWLSGTLMGAVSEYYRRSVKERTAEGQARAVARGAIPWANVPLGYRRKDNGTLETDPETVDLARRAFQMRADGVSVMKIREMLKDHGVERSPRGVQVMLANRIYLGEIHYGKLVNLAGCEPIIEHDLFTRVQRLKVPRGPQPASDRLLARLGILRCGSCGSRLGTMKLPKQDNYPIYRCGSTNDCSRHVTISAELAEEVVSRCVRDALADAEERATLASNVAELSVALERAQDDLDSALRSFSATGLQAEPAAVQRLGELRQARDDAQAAIDQVGGSDASSTVNAARDWDSLTRDEQRTLIRATVASAVVAPVRRGASADEKGPARIAIRLVGQALRK